MNLICSLETSGDWHQSAIQWQKPRMRESDGSLFGTYGIEKNSKVPEHSGTFYVANHIRALLDLIEEGNFATAQGMRDNFICNDKYTQEIFLKVILMQNLPHWQKITEFMSEEYLLDWIKFLKFNGIEFYDQRQKKLSAATFKTCDINEQVKTKALAYNRHNTLQDILDIIFICEKFWEKLEDSTKKFLRHSLEYKNLEQFEYAFLTQSNTLLDFNFVRQKMFALYDKLGLRWEADVYGENGKYKA